MDIAAAVKVQTEDDITASLVVPASQLQNSPPVGDWELQVFREL
jgi:hypothetical protein